MNEKFELVSAFAPCGDQPEAIEKLCDGLAKNLKKQILLGVTGCGKTFTIANVIARANRPAILIAHNKTLAAQLYAEMKAFFPNNKVEYFVSYYDFYQPEAYLPVTNTYIEKDAAINEQIEQMRLSATKAILERRDTIIVSTVSAIYGLGEPENYLQMLLHLEKGAVVDREDVLRKLAELQYTRNEVTLERGNFRAKGDVIDIFPSSENAIAVKIELFENEIINIYEFDPLTGRRLNKINRVTIYPKNHFVTPKEVIDKAISQIKEDLKKQEKYFHDLGKFIEEQRIRERTTYDIEMMLEIGYCKGIENYSRYLSRREAGSAPATLMDYLPEDSLVIIDESHVTVSQIGAMYAGDKSRKDNLVQYGFRLPSALDNRPLTFAEFERFNFQTIYVSATPGDYELEHAQNIAEIIVRPTGLVDPEVIIKSADHEIDDLLEEIKKAISRNERVFIISLTKKMAEEISEYYFDQGIKVRYLHSDIGTVERVAILKDLRLGKFDVLVGINLLREGLDLPEVALVAILDADKEGFLRSKRSIIQTSGRAARNVDGRVILYANKKTKAICEAVQEMQRRRNIQLAYNEKHHVTPKTIYKKIEDSLEGEKVVVKENVSSSINFKRLASLSQGEFDKYIAKLEAKMLQFSQNLEFEKAAKIRDDIAKLVDQRKKKK